MLKRFLYALGASLLIIQFIRPDKNISAEPSKNDISSKFAMSAQVTTSLQKACYDCHSNNTRYPWYNNIQPVAWWLDHHVTEGKSELNFNEFTTYSAKKQDHKLEEIAEAVTDGWMPLKPYKFAHKESELTAAEKQAIISWVSQSRSLLNNSQESKASKESNQE